MLPRPALVAARGVLERGAALRAVQQIVVARPRVVVVISGDRKSTAPCQGRRTKRRDGHMEGGKVQARAQASVARRAILTAANAHGFASEQAEAASAEAARLEKVAERLQAGAQEDCPTCNGHGRLERQGSPSRSYVTCADCDGMGKLERCGKCSGWGWLEDSRGQDREDCDRCNGNGVMLNGRAVRL